MRAKEVTLEELLGSWVKAREKSIQANADVVEATKAQGIANSDLSSVSTAIYKLGITKATVYNVNGVGILLMPGQYPAAVELGNIS